MISAALVRLVRCPDCTGALLPDGQTFRCSRCSRLFDGSRGYLDLRPTDAFAEQTKYLDEALHSDARHASVSPPLLGSKIRNDMLRACLGLRPADRAVDLGCGSGRALVWNADTRATIVGIDISAFFAPEALDRCDVLLGDLRRLPLGDATFTAAWSIDVLEHLSREALYEMLTEANRILVDDGVLFVYTHVRKNGWIAGPVRLANRFARLCERLGLIDLTQERLRKSDHVNSLADHEDFARVLGDCGFRLEHITYYTPVFGAFVENVMVRIAEQILVRRSRRPGPGMADRVKARREARADAKSRLSRRRGITYRALVVLSAVMKLDLLLFGRLRSGPFFALVRKNPRGGG